MRFKDYYNKNVVLKEAYFSDAYPKAFLEFYNKWKKHKKDSSLYVRFDNGNTTDVLSRGASKTPTHSDPIGTYAYPLKYVIDYPGDIWYGHNSSYLKVIKNKTKKGYVRLDTMDDIDARNYLRKVGLDGGYYLAQKFYPDRAKGSTAPGKLFMSALQMDFSGATLPKNRNTVSEIIKPKIRSSEEQTELLLRMGINTLEDSSKDFTKASINAREPEQILWLRPTDYEILETFRLSDKNRKHSNVTVNAKILSRKIAANIAKIMNDSLTDDSSDTEFWTKKERKIIITTTDVSLEYRKKNLKIGEKPHRFFKKYNQYQYTITVLSERGEFNEIVFADDKIETVLSDFKNSWDKKEGIDNKQRYSRKQQEEKEKRERDERIEKENAKKKILYAEKFDLYVVPDYNVLSKYLNFEEMPKNLTVDEKAETYKFLEAQILDSNNAIFQIYTNVRKDVLQNYQKILNFVNNPHPWRFPGHNLKDALEKLKNKNNI